MKPEEIRIVPSWSKSKADIWNEVFAALPDETPASVPKKRRLHFWKYVAAAVVVGLVCLVGSYRYEVTKTAAWGRHLSIILPDGSKVRLNADSRVSYKPYWWFFSREVELRGEAFFEVTHGRRFDVQSPEGRVSVLGTTFNIFARPQKYTVSCLSGKVRVETARQLTVLTPGMVLTNQEGRLRVADDETAARQSAGWTQGRFVFVGLPLEEVLEEVERQYGIKIARDNDLDHTFTGNFVKTEHPEDALDIIGRPFGIKFSYKIK